MEVLKIKKSLLKSVLVLFKIKISFSKDLKIRTMENMEW